MLKRIIPIIICFVLLFSIRVMAENDTTAASDGTPSESQQTSQDEKGIDEDFAKDGNMPQFPDGNGFPGMQTTGTEQTESETSFFETYITPITSVFLLILAFIFVVFYRRKHF